eukprot:519018-Amphidinium_carterae.1
MSRTAPSDPHQPEGVDERELPIDCPTVQRSNRLQVPVSFLSALHFLLSSSPDFRLVRVLLSRIVPD